METVYDCIGFTTMPVTEQEEEEGQSLLHPSLETDSFQLLNNHLLTSGTDILSW